MRPSPNAGVTARDPAHAQSDTPAASTPSCACACAVGVGGMVAARMGRAETRGGGARRLKMARTRLARLSGRGWQGETGGAGPGAVSALAKRCGAVYLFLPL